MYSCLSFVPKNHLSFCVGKLASIALPRRLQLPLNRMFVRLTGIDMDEAEFPLESYTTVSQLFTRRLKPGTRPVRGDIVNPVDGTLRSFGRIQGGALPQIKEKTYSLEALIHDDSLARQFEGGTFFNFYLSPQDYHWVHSPAAGTIEFRRYIPGKLWPVNDWSMERIDGLFTINERVVIGIRTRWGLVVVVMVGATNVGKIGLAFDSLKTNTLRGKEDYKRFEPLQPINQGQELGLFHLGSSVVLLLEPQIRGRVQATIGPVKMGQAAFAV